MFDSPQYPKHSQLCMTQSPKYYHENQNQIFVGSYDYELFNFQCNREDSLNLNLNLNINRNFDNFNCNGNWSVFSQRTPNTDRLKEQGNIQVSYYESTFTDRSMCQGTTSIISEKRKRIKNQKYDFFEFINTSNQSQFNPKDMLKELNIAKVKQQLKNLTKNMLKSNENEKIRQPLIQQNVDNHNMNNKEQITNIQDQPTKFKHINKKNMPTRKIIPKFKKSQTTTENQIIQSFSTLRQQQISKYEQNNQENLQFTNIELNSAKKIDQKLHDICIQVYRFTKRKQEESIKKQLQKQKISKRYEELLQKKSELKQKLANMKQILIEKQSKIQEDSHLFIYKLRKQIKIQFTTDWDKYFQN